MTPASRTLAVAALLPAVFAGVVLSGCAAGGPADSSSAPSGGLSVAPALERLRTVGRSGADRPAAWSGRV